jgi:hypothetical protein
VTVIAFAFANCCCVCVCACVIHSIWFTLPVVPHHPAAHLHFLPSPSYPPHPHHHQVAKLQRASLRDPVKVEVSAKYGTVKTLIQQYLFIPAKYKDCYTAFILNVQTHIHNTSHTCIHAYIHKLTHTHNHAFLGLWVCPNTTLNPKLTFCLQICIGCHNLDFKIMVPPPFSLSLSRFFLFFL